MIVPDASFDVESYASIGEVKFMGYLKMKNVEHQILGSRWIAMYVSLLKFNFDFMQQIYIGLGRFPDVDRALKQ